MEAKNNSLFSLLTITKSKSNDSLETHRRPEEETELEENTTVTYQFQAPFFKKLDECIALLKTVLSLYVAFENKDINSFYLQLEFKFSKLNFTFIKGLLTCFKSFQKESHKAQCLRIYDFIVYEYAKLRNFYLEATGDYFNLDEELKYCKIIQVVYENQDLLPSINGNIYLDYLTFYLEKLIRRLENFEISKKYIESYRILNVKIKFLSYLFSSYMIPKNPVTSKEQHPCNERWIELLKITDKKVKIVPS